jgi:hypothetical protein
LRNPLALAARPPVDFYLRLPRQSVLLGLQKFGRRVLDERHINLNADDVAEAFGLEMVNRNGRQEVSEQKASRAK